MSEQEIIQQHLAILDKLKSSFSENTVEDFKRFFLTGVDVGRVLAESKQIKKEIASLKAQTQPTIVIAND